MTDERDERLFQRAAASLRAPGARDDEALREVLPALRREFEAGPSNDGRERAIRPGFLLRARRRPFVPREAARFIAGMAAGIAFAAGLGIGLFAGWGMRGASYRAAEDVTLRAVTPAHVAGTALVPPIRPVQFMLVAPSATRVALVGEFNDWDPAATPMTRAPGGAWHVAFPLARGRHVYAFVVDGSSWVADPQAPLAPERWFGARNSVLLVSGEVRQ